MTHCPNCGTAWPPNAPVCPHCGWTPPPPPDSPPPVPPAPWPPPMAGYSPPSPPPVPKMVTGAAWGDMTLGISLSFLSCFLGGLGFVLMPILYFSLREQYPVLMRGIGYGFLAGAALLLGAIAWCFAAIFSSH